LSANTRAFPPHRKLRISTAQDDLAKGGKPGYLRGMEIEEPTAAFAVRVPASSEVVELAMDLVRRFPECFWFRHPEAKVRYLDDARLVVDHLREYGDKRTWEAAKELQKCL